MNSREVERMEGKAVLTETEAHQPAELDDSGPSRLELETRLVDLKNLLVVINGHCELLLNEDSLSATESDSLKEIYVAGARAEELTLHFFDNKALALSNTGLNPKLDWERDKVKPADGTESILLVEDDESVRLLSVAILQKYGYRVLSAASAEEAIEVWERHAGRPELLLTDLVLPGKMSGHGLAEYLKQRKPALKIIFTSGHSARTSGQIFKMEPGFAFVQKPFRPATLAELVRQVLDGETSGK